MVDSFTDRIARGFAAGIASISKEWEIFAYGRQVTGKTNSLTIEMPGEEQSPGDPLGRWRGEDRTTAFTGLEPCREMAVREGKSPDRGIDL